MFKNPISFILLISLSLSSVGETEKRNEIDDVVFASSDLSELSTYVKVINPFDGNMINGFINPKNIDADFLKIIPTLSDRTGGSFWHNATTNQGDFFRIDSSGYEEVELIDELSYSIVSGRIFDILPLNFLNDDDLAYRAISIKGRYDSVYTIYHELAHTQRVGDNRNVTHEASLSQIKNLGILENGQDHYNVYHSIRESLADLASVIYMKNHNIIKDKDYNLFLMGLIMERANSSTYFEKNGDLTHKIKGDDTHNTAQSLIYFYKLITKNPDLVSGLKDNKIIEYSLKLIHRALAIS